MTGGPSEVMKTGSDVPPHPHPYATAPSRPLQGRVSDPSVNGGRGRSDGGKMARWALCALALAEVGLAPFSEGCFFTSSMLCALAGDLNEGRCGSAHLGC